MVNLVVYGITLALALWPKTSTPGVIWLAITFFINVSAYWLVPDGDPRKDFVWLLIPSFLQLLIFLLARGVVKWRDDSQPLMFFAGWQVGSVATFIYLTFFDGYDYTWWNWMIALPVNAFMAEIWPVYWFILRLIFGY